MTALTRKQEIIIVLALRIQYTWVKVPGYDRDQLTPQHAIGSPASFTRFLKRALTQHNEALYQIYCRA